jgi:hypothetical protein
MEILHWEVRTLTTSCSSICCKNSKVNIISISQMIFLLSKEFEKQLKRSRLNYLAKRKHK